MLPDFPEIKCLSLHSLAGTSKGTGILESKGRNTGSETGGQAFYLPISSRPAEENKGTGILDCSIPPTPWTSPTRKPVPLIRGRIRGTDTSIGAAEGRVDKLGDRHLGLLTRGDGKGGQTL